MDRLFDALAQLKLFRILFGGHWVKMQGHWYECAPMLVLHDGSRVLRRLDDGGGSFHETFNGIEAIEEYS